MDNKSIKSVANNGTSTCAVTVENEIYCWGASKGMVGSTDLYALGDGSTTSSETPVLVDMHNLSDKRISNFSSAEFSYCLATRDGKVYCWGGTIGEFGRVPEELSGGELNGNEVINLTALSSGACVIDINHKVYCRSCISGIPGVEEEDYPGVDFCDTFIKVNLPQDFSTISLASGTGHVCAASIDKRVYCWGRVGKHLGYEKIEGEDSPKNVDISVIPSDDNIISVSAGYNHSCILTSAYQIYCWGENNYGQLGNDSNTDSLSPVLVNRPNE